MNILAVQNLSKTYPSFRLDNISFTLEEGTIMGLVGRNGAGKTTTLNSLLNLVHADSGKVSFFGMDFQDSEWEIKQRLGFVSGGADWYPRKKCGTITRVARRFYRDWDDGAYRRYLSLFQLSEEKTPAELSAGMKVKFSLALALSHKAKLLILDEPTSGLDPVSREELLDVFLSLVRQEGVSILFSTHITSDLEKCADSLTYIRKGKSPYSGPLKDFLGKYRVARFPEKPAPGRGLTGIKREKEGWSALLEQEAPCPSGGELSPADLDAVMVHLECGDLFERESKS